ncbi:MAG: Xaa-Pro aminopeptidase [Clostridiales bacterium]|jgi:Xaa-Pro aminopeptidase|nr:Xaa-Pro aminopeptidase [Clostridiales bacterium]MDN5281853.1 Xaa-Pro aminopeptidase [Candidatus Ozemobacter sp.]
MNYSKRLDAYKKIIEKNKDFQAVLVTDSSNIRYLCGFSGSCGYLLVTRKEAYFFTDFRYQEQSAREIGNAAKIEVFNNNSIETICKRVKSCKVKTLGVEKSMTLDLFLNFKEAFSGEIRPVNDHIRVLRQKKDADELKSLKKAFAIADKAFAELMKEMKPGLTEVEVAAKLEYFMKSGGSEAPSFSTIIASGPNSSCPHAQPSSRKIKKGDMVKIDFGAVYNGYHSDMTRTVFMGPVSEKFKKIYSVVLKAQKDAVKAIKIGVRCNEIDKVARQVIADAGYGENFGHGLGHSLGLDVHESPSLAPKCDSKIEAGMAFTVEPGIYLPGWGGIRIEDVFLVEENKLVKLTKTPNSLLEIKV